MKKNEVVVGGSYLAKVSGKVVPVRITGESRFGGWDAVNTDTNRQVRIKSAQRLRRPADAKTKAAVVSDNILLRVEPGQFADALNKATVAQLEDALKLECWSAKQRGRIEAALANRKKVNDAIADGQKAAAEGVAKTVAAVEKGDLTKGVEVPMPAKRAHGKQLKQAEAERRAERKAEAKANAGGKVTMSKADAVDAAMKAVAADKAKRASGLDAAAKVLAENGKPMSTGEMVEQMLAKGYWQTGGKTPAATIYAAILREINVKAGDSRFRKTDRGRFDLTAAGKQAQ